MASDAVWERLNAIENSVTKLKEQMHESEKVDIVMQNEVDNLTKSLDSFRTEMTTILLKQNERIWGLIKSGVYVILLLIVFILAIVGIKVGPEVLKLFLGGI